MIISMWCLCCLSQKLCGIQLFNGHHRHHHQHHTDSMASRTTYTHTYSRWKTNSDSICVSWMRFEFRLFAQIHCRSRTHPVATAPAASLIHARLLLFDVLDNIYNINSCSSIFYTHTGHSCVVHTMVDVVHSAHTIRVQYIFFCVCVLKMSI